MTTQRLPASAGRADALILVLHGVGGNAGSVAPLAKRLSLALPWADIIAPNAPWPFRGTGPGHEWFSTEGVTENNRPARIVRALPSLEAIADDALEDAGLGRDRLGVVGFSQGAMMALALAVGLNPPATVVAIAGRLAAPIGEPVARRPNILLLHGDADPVVPVRCSKQAAAALRGAGFPVTLDVRLGLAHTIASEQAEIAAAHLGESLWGQPAKTRAA